MSTTAKTTTNVTKGFELPQKEHLSTTPRSLSPASGRQTPIVAQNAEQNEERASKLRDNANKVDVNAQYKKNVEAVKSIYIWW